jgi:TfoX/Sxy family transcriptional regulator of competence genes
MFGGVAFLVDEKMACGVVDRDLMVRIGPGAHDVALAQPHVRPMDFPGRPMLGYVYVAPEGLTTEPALREWVERGLAFAASLPPKKGKQSGAQSAAEGRDARAHGHEGPGRVARFRAPRGSGAGSCCSHPAATAPGEWRRA